MLLSVYTLYDFYSFKFLKMYTMSFYTPLNFYLFSNVIWWKLNLFQNIMSLNTLKFHKILPAWGGDQWDGETSRVGRHFGQESLVLLTKLPGYTLNHRCSQKHECMLKGDCLNIWKKYIYIYRYRAKNGGFFWFGKRGCTLNITEWYYWKKIWNNLICARKLLIFSFSHFYTLSLPCKKALNDLTFA